MSDMQILHVRKILSFKEPLSEIKLPAVLQTVLKEDLEV